MADMQHLWYKCLNNIILNHLNFVYIIQYILKGHQRKITKHSLLRDVMKERRTMWLIFMLYLVVEMLVRQRRKGNRSIDIDNVCKL